MGRHKVSFTGSQGGQLAGSLETPEGEAQAYVLFAHCFTCGKDIAAASRVARALTRQGLAVLRFDFTGLGNSDGDFANTNFSSNVQDLIAAADFLRAEYNAPSLLIGHSLGGTAVLQAAAQLPECKGVVTIGSPSSASHVAHQFACDIDAIETDGQAEVTLASRKFTIKKQFIDDLRAWDSSALSNLNAALLVMHSPVDKTVAIDNAEAIYRGARHPKSFVSLDNADHLLSNADDAAYVADTIAAWAKRYIGSPDKSPARPSVTAGHVVVAERDHKFAQNVYSDTHQWIADEPVRVGGSDIGPDPYDHLLAALGTCTTMTMRMYANRKGWPVKHVSVELSHARQHGDDCAACDEAHPQIDVISRRITIEGDLDDAQRKRMMEIADRCPVHRTLHGKLVIETEAQEAST